MGGTSTDINGILFLHEDDFYAGDGCYTFEIKVTNQYSTSEPVVTESSMKWELQFDRYNNAETNEEKQDSRTYLMAVNHNLSRVRMGRSLMFVR